MNITNLEWLRRSCEASGVPLHIDNPETIELLVSLLKDAEVSGSVTVGNGVRSAAA